MADNRAHVLDFDDTPIASTSNVKSEDYNDILNSLKAGVLRSINRSRTLTTQLTNMNRALVAENEYLGKKFVELNRDVPLVDSTALITGYDFFNFAGYRKNVEQDRLTGQVTVAAEPGRKWSKLPRYTDVNGKRRPSRDTYITLDGTSMPYTDDVYNILDGRNDTFWIYDTVKDTQHTLVITTPSSIRPYINNILMTAFPAFGFKVDSISVLKTDGTTYEVAPEGIEAGSMGTVDTHFAPTSWGNQVTVTFTAMGSVVGISSLDMFLVDYVNEVAEISFEVTAFANKTFNTISQVDLMDFGLQGVAGETDLAYNRYNELTVTAYVGASTPGDDANPTVISAATLQNKEVTDLNTAKTSSNKFFIGFKYKKYNGQSPVLRSAKITYRS